MSLEKSSNGNIADIAIPNFNISVGNIDTQSGWI